MSIEIKKSIKPINYHFAVKKMEERVNSIINKKAKNELIWFLEHPSIYTGGSSFKQNEILDNSIDVIKTSRGGKITWHGPGQLICYLVIDLNKRKKDIRKFINLIENVIIKTLNDYKIESFSDRKNIGIWYKKKNKIFKVASIGIRVKNWVAYHGFSININNNLNSYKKIIPCGINNREVINLLKIKNQNYKKIINKLEKNLIIHLKN
tara:strand:+ start:16 stop:639 length:624 start_codon:yes stop_codon:yes gene_type:complete